MLATDFLLTVIHGPTQQHRLCILVLYVLLVLYCWWWWFVMLEVICLDAEMLYVIETGELF